MKNFAQKAYQTTKLDSDYTQGKINQMLQELNIRQIRVTNENDDYSLEFFVKMSHDESPRKVRIDIPLTTELKDSLKRRKKRENILFRILFYHLKERFVSVSNGLKSFEEAFLADLVIMHNGEERRLGDVIIPQYKHQLKTNKVAILNITN